MFPLPEKTSTDFMGFFCLFFFSLVLSAVIKDNKGVTVSLRMQNRISRQNVELFQPRVRHIKGKWGIQLNPLCFRLKTLW